MTQDCTRDDLLALVPEHDTLVGIDSDGCVFDTMEIKQKQCFHGEIIEHWGLQAIEPLVRETAEFVNLYSVCRGRNRFISLVDVMHLLAERPEVIAAGVPVPTFPELEALINSGVPLGNPALEEAVAETDSPQLADALAWSLKVNKNVAQLPDIPPFEWARKGLDMIAQSSDAIVVSQTPVEALTREWATSGIANHVRAIAGQELGTKAEHLELATGGRYARGKVLMIGDAPGDRAAAEQAGALFYPINPGHENESWRQFCEEAYMRFLDGTFAGGYEDACIARFEALLPSTPSWRTV